MKKKNVILILAAVAVVLILLVVGAKSGWFGAQGNFKEVEIQKIGLQDIVEKVSATGKIQPEKEVKISSEVSGEIIELPFREGAQVKKGELLVKINPDLIQSMVSRSQATYQNVRANLEQSEATLKESKSSYERSRQLFEKGIISKSEWDKAISSYEVAKAGRQSAYFNVQSAGASVNEAMDNLNRTTIYAPMDGTISKLDVELGERVVGTQQMAGTEILRVANLKNMEVEIDVNENDIVKVHIGDSTIVEVDAYLKKQFKGIVTEIANSAASALTADQVTNFKVKVKILESSYQDLLEGKPDHYSPFRPGMTATVDIITKRRTNVVIVPISAIVIKTDTTAQASILNKSENPTSSNASKVKDERFECVFVKVNDEAKLRVVTTGIQDDANIEILSGVKAGEEIIVGPYNMVSKTLKVGDKIEVKKKTTPQD